jgi:hypothetical protein
MRNYSRTRWIVGAISATALGCLVVFISAAGGHGNYWAAKIIFPWAILVASISDRFVPVAIGTALLQFPIYAAISKRRKRTTAVLMCVSHVLAIVAATFYASDSFRP